MHHAAALAQVALLGGEHPRLPAEQATHGFQVDAMVFRVGDRRHVQGQQVRLGAIQDAAQGRIDLSEAAVEIDDRHAVGGRGEGLAEPALAGPKGLFHPALGRDVQDLRDDLARGAVLAPHQGARDPGPDGRAIGTQVAFFPVIRGFVAAEGGIQPAHVRRPVFRVGDGEHGMPHQGLGRPAEDDGQGVVDAPPAAFGIQQGHPVGGLVEGIAEPGLQAPVVGRRGRWGRHEGDVRSTGRGGQGEGVVLEHRHPGRFRARARARRVAVRSQQRHGATHQANARAGVGHAFHGADAAPGARRAVREKGRHARSPRPGERLRQEGEVVPPAQDVRVFRVEAPRGRLIGRPHHAGAVRHHHGLWRQLQDRSEGQGRHGRVYPVGWGLGVGGWSPAVGPGRAGADLDPMQGG